MARDHYVAQTYLRRFGDPGHGFLMHGYLKSRLNDFPCHPRDICHEWDGDLNAEFISSRPELRGDFRALCEPRWNGAVDHLLAGRADAEDKFVMSAMVATLMGCTPAGRRNHVAMSNALARNVLIAGHDVEVNAGKTPSLDAETVEALRSGRLSVNTDPKFVEAEATAILLRQAQVTFEQPWLVLYNPANSAPFITSDNPLVPLFPKPKGGLTRFLPITPKLCLEIPFVRVREPTSDITDLRSLIPGSISYAEICAADARDINKLVVQCAEDLVLAPGRSEGIRKLVAKYAKWGIDHDFTVDAVPGENAVIHGSVMRVRERTA